MEKLDTLPNDLPKPDDDGACDHLTGMSIPDLLLQTTSGNLIDIAKLNGLTVLYFYPMTGRLDIPLPTGWNRIPGARGCTPQACSFRDHYAELKSLDCEVYGISTQSSDYQKEALQRLHLPFELLSDIKIELRNSISLPTFMVDGNELYKRFTLIMKDSKIIKVFYPVFPPQNNPDEVIHWLKNNR